MARAVGEDAGQVESGNDRERQCLEADQDRNRLLNWSVGVTDDRPFRCCGHGFWSGPLRSLGRQDQRGDERGSGQRGRHPEGGPECVRDRRGRAQRVMADERRRLSDSAVEPGQFGVDRTLEHDREQRAAERAGDPLDHVQGAGRLRDLRVLEVPLSSLIARARSITRI
jgi:hypothetical protein